MALRGLADRPTHATSIPVQSINVTLVGQLPMVTHAQSAASQSIVQGEVSLNVI
jgi:hypothetical protein